MTLTKREKIVAGIFILSIPIVFTVPQHIITNYELQILVFIIAPIGFLLATDPERRENQ